MQQGRDSNVRSTRLRAEMHIGLLATLAGTLLFVNESHPAAKLVGAILAVIGTGKLFSHWLGLRKWLPVVLSGSACCLMACQFWVSVGIAFGSTRLGFWQIGSGFVTGGLFLVLFGCSGDIHA